MLLIPLTFALTALAAYLVVGRIRILAERKMILDIPNARSSHSRPTPRGGGLGIVLVTFIGVVLTQLFGNGWPAWQLAGFTAGAVLIAFISWLDDVHNLPSSIRMLAHCGAAVIAVLAIGTWSTVNIPLLGEIQLGWLGYPLAFLWVVGMINAYNFMDGIDGLAGGQAVIAACGWCLFGWWSDQAAIVALALLLGASSLGFLGHNWPPARIFMGDVGSTFLGYSLAVLALWVGQYDNSSLFLGVMFLWPFLFDAIATFLRRLYQHEDVFASHRSHYYQRLVIARYSHLNVTVAYLLLALAGLAAALAWRMQLPGSGVVALILIPVLAVGLVLYTRMIEQRQRA